MKSRIKSALMVLAVAALMMWPAVTAVTDGIIGGG
jgi:hypothetical protein